MLLNFALYLALLGLFLTFFLDRTSTVHAAGTVMSVALTFSWLWIAICFREPSGDPYRYMRQFDVIRELGFADVFSYGKAPIGFVLLNWVVGQLSGQSWVFFSAMYALAIGSLYYAMRLFLGRLHGTAALMLYSMYPFYVNYLASGFKQGIATGLVLVGVAKLLGRKKTGLLWLFAATLFHASTWLCLVVLLAWTTLPRPTSRRLVPIVLAATFLLGASGLAQPLVESFLPTAILERLGFSAYFDKEFQESGEFLSINLVTGFRWDFATFTLLPILVWCAYRRRLRALTDLMVVYSLFASLYFLLSFVPYADRIAGFAWALVPVLVYRLALGAFDTRRGQRIVVATLALYPPLMLTYMSTYFR